MFVSDATIKIAEFINDAWEWIFGILVITAGIVWGWLVRKVIGKYADKLDKIDTLEEDIKELADITDRIEQELRKMEASNFLPRKDADKMVHAVQEEHEKMFKEQTRQHEQQREDFKHLVNRIDDLYEFLSGKR